MTNCIWCGAEQLWLPFRADVLHDGHRLCELDALVDQVGQVGEVKAETELDVEPLGPVEVRSRPSSEHFVLKLDSTEVQKVAHLGAEPSDVPVAKSRPRLQIQAVSLFGGGDGCLQRLVLSSQLANFLFQSSNLRPIPSCLGRRSGGSGSAAWPLNLVQEK